MIYGLYLSATGIITASHQQDVIANNLANAETGGFKRQLALTEARQMESQVRQAMGVRDPLNHDIGGGQFLAPSYFDQSEGIMVPTGDNFDIAVQGKGFIAQGEGGETRLTRNGSLMLDKDGTVRTSAGHVVLNDQKQPLKLDMTGLKKSDLSFRADGGIYAAGNDSPIGKVGLLQPTDETQIKPVGGNRFAPTKDAKLVPATGRLVDKVVEGSNVDPATELTKLMETQRLLEANANLIRTQDQTLGRAVNEVGKIG